MTLNGKHPIFLLAMIFAATTAEAQRDNILPYIPKADLTLTVRPSASTVHVYSMFHFTIEVFNNGPSRTDATISFNPGEHANVHYVTAVSLGGASLVSLNPIRVANVLRGTRVVFQLHVIAYHVGTLTSVASVSSSVEDPTPLNNNVSLHTTVRAYQANLSVALLRVPKTMIITKPEEFVIEVVNNGPDVAHNVRAAFSTNAPIEYGGYVEIQTVTAGTPSGCDWTSCRFDDFPSGARAWLRVRLRPRQVGYLRVTAVVTATEDDPVLTNNTDSGIVFVDPGTAPIAEAGNELYTTSLQAVTLDGTQSQDADGDVLSYFWSFTGRPPGSSAVLQGQVSTTPWFVPDRRGRFVLKLVVNDGFHEREAFVGVTVVNTPPVARAGRDQTAAVGSTVVLDGGASSDSDGDQLQYHWSVRSGPSGSSALLSEALTVNPTFSPDLPGTYVLDLLVGDGDASSYADRVVISTTNSRPVADAGVDKRVHLLDTVRLNGGGSWDVDGDRLRYFWSFVGLPEGVAAPLLENHTSPRPSFKVPASGTYIVQLAVRDADELSMVDTVTITTNGLAPVARAGSDRLVTVGSTVTLEGQDSNATIYSTPHYIWALTTTPPGSAAALDLGGADATFVVDLPGTYVAQLFVHDGFVASAADTVTVTTGNLAPTANAGDDKIVRAANVVLLNGSQSFDANGDGISFRWSIVAQPMARTLTGARIVVANANTAGPSFVPEEPGLYVVQLIVNDGVADSVPDTVIIKVIE